MPDYRIDRYSGCIVNGVRYHTETRDASRSTQNYGIWVEGEHNGNTCDFYGAITDIWELSYLLNHKVVLFKCTWYKTDGRNNIREEYHLFSINVSSKWYTDQPFILANQANQVFYLRDDKLGSNWKVVQKVHHRHLWDIPKEMLENAKEFEDDVNFSSEAYQEERSDDINVTFDEAINVDITLNREDEGLIEIDAVPLDDFDDQIQHALDADLDSDEEFGTDDSAETNDITATHDLVEEIDDLDESDESD